MEFDEIRITYNTEKRHAREKYINSIKQYLKDHHLDGLVRSRRSGKVGWIDFDVYNDLHFYPKTKKGERSLKATAFVFDIMEYEPAIEGDQI